MNVSEAARYILAHHDQWGVVPIPLIPQELVALAEGLALNRDAELGDAMKLPRNQQDRLLSRKLRAMTDADRQAIATRRADLKARGLMA